MKGNHKDIIYRLVDIWHSLQSDNLNVFQLLTADTINITRERETSYSILTQRA